ncbi:MAG: DUF4214 domain-containing protein [Candidatus Entotheonellia bacterium]
MTQRTVVTGRSRQTAAMRSHPVLGRRSWGLGLVMAVLLGLTWTSIGHGAPGDLDPTFGTGGIAITFGPSDFANALVVQPDGNLVVAGLSSGDGVTHVLLVRYLPDGGVDGSFGHGGKVTTTVGTRSGANAVLQQPDGKLVVAGFSAASMEVPGDVLLARYLPDGRLDASFGIGGAVTTDFGAGDQANALILQPDGKLVVAGGSSPGPHVGNTILARYHPDGSLDGSFGVGGKAIVNLGGASNGASALLIQPDGKLVVTGFAGASRVMPSSLVIARFQPEGSLDPTFGQAGKVTFTSPSAGQALIQQPDGNLVVAGSFSTSSSSGLLLVRYLPDGRMDPAFGTAGVVMTDVGVPALPRALIQQPDGKLVAGGYRAANGANDILLVRYLPDGSLDPAFGTGGSVITDAGGGELASALFQQPDGALVVAGWFSGSGATDILVARYQALGCPLVNPEACRAQLATFVTDVYLAVLGRQPDSGEVDYWVDVLETDPTPDTARAMLHVVFDGPEFRQRPVNPWQYVEALYHVMLGRDPAPAELDWWVQAVLDHFDTVLPEFIDSPEFQRLVPSCQDQAAVTLLVGRLYQQVLRRIASTEELSWWTADITIWCDIQDAVEVFFNSLEYLSVPRTLADHVTVLYRALLAREPDAGGLAWWVDDLAGQLAALEDDIMASLEFEAHVFRLFP